MIFLNTKIKLERRKFFKQTCQFCLAAISATAVASFLESCSTINTITGSIDNDSISVAFTELENKDNLIVKSKGNEFDVALIKQSDGEWKALQMMCTHLSNPVFFNGDTFRCNVHFSEFNKNGQPQSGPATKPLKVLQLEKKSDHYLIRLS